MRKIGENMNVRLNLFWQYGFDTPVGKNVLNVSAK